MYCNKSYATMVCCSRSLSKCVIVPYSPFLGLLRWGEVLQCACVMKQRAVRDGGRRDATSGYTAPPLGGCVRRRSICLLTAWWAVSDWQREQKNRALGQRPCPPGTPRSPIAMVLEDPRRLLGSQGWRKLECEEGSWERKNRKEKDASGWK